MPPKTDLITTVRERGCAVLVVLLITMPLWVITLAWRGPLFAIGALAVLFLVVFGLGVMSQLGRGR